MQYRNDGGKERAIAYGTLRDRLYHRASRSSVSMSDRLRHTSRSPILKSEPFTSQKNHERCHLRPNLTDSPDV
ncbi:MAG: hypothetical protein U7123_18910 [Potamolinea sp.]